MPCQMISFLFYSLRPFTIPWTKNLNNSIPWTQYLGSTLLDAIPWTKTIGSKTVELIPWTNHKISHVCVLFSAWKCVNLSLYERKFSLHESAWNFLCMKVRELFSMWKELFSAWKEIFSAWKCVNFSLHERNFFLHESAWNVLCVKVRELENNFFSL